MSEPKFTLFVSSVPEHTVYRFGTRQLLGARRVNMPVQDGDPRKLRNPDAVELQTVWFPERVIPITEAEARQYANEYRGAIAAGALRERKEDDWKVYLATEGKPKAPLAPTPDK